MTPAEIKKTRLYRTLAPCVRKKDREELARMLAMVPQVALDEGMDSRDLTLAFIWAATPQGAKYWHELSISLQRAGHECW